MPQRLVKQLTGRQLMEYAASLLSARAMSSNELRRKLRRKAADTAEIDAVVAQLQESCALDDARFAANFAESRAESGQRGRARVLADLLAKRVEPQAAQHAVDEAFRDFDETRAVEQWLARKYRGQNLHEMLKSQAKFSSAYRRLRTAGFSSPSSLKVLKRIAGSDAAEIDLPEDPISDSM